MAMTLRLTDAEARALRRRAEHEGRPMQEPARQAIREYVEGHGAPSCLIAFSMKNCLVTPRRWSVWVSDLPDAAGVAACC
jgi:hypothetical protein